MRLYELSDPSYRMQCFLEILLAIALDCVEGFCHFGVDDKFTDFVHLGVGSVLIIGAQDPPFVIPVSSPAAANYGRLDALTLNEPLNHTNLAPVAKNRRQDGFHFCRADDLNIVSARSSVSKLGLF
jgi:hypothetical protein